MMIQRIHEASNSVLDWVRDNAVIITYLLGLTLTGIIWGTDITARVNTIERRGSPEVAVIDRRVSNIEYWITSHDKGVLAAQNSPRISALERSIAVIQEHDNTILQALKDNAATIGKINDTLTRHMLDMKQQK